MTQNVERNAHDPAVPESEGSRHLYEGDRISLRLDTLRIKGRPSYRKEIVEHPGSTVLVPRMNDGSIMFVRQWRPAADIITLELPSGTLERGEDPHDSAARELREETGFRAENLRFLGKLWVAPGYSEERSYAYLAEGLIHDPLPQDVGEDIVVELISSSTVEYLALSGQLQDSLSLAALWLMKLMESSVPKIEQG